MNINQLFNHLKNGLFHILISSILSKILLFILTIIIIRLLSEKEYGIWTYSITIINTMLIFNGLGISSGLLQFSSKVKSEKIKEAYLIFSTKYSIVISFIYMILIIFLFGIFQISPIRKSNNLIVLMALFPLIYIIFDIIQIYLRSNSSFIKYSFNLTLKTGFHLIIIIPLGYFFGFYGIVFSYYISLLFLILLNMKYFNIKKPKIKINIEKKKLIEFSFISMITIGVSTLLYFIDIISIGIILQDEILVANYKVATLIPINLTLIPISIATYVYPKFALNQKKKKWVLLNIKKIVALLIVVNLVVVAILIILSPYYYHLLFGDMYSKSLNVYYILLLGYFVGGSLRTPIGNIIVSLGKVKINLIIAIISIISNLALNVILIPIFHEMGAAYATFFSLTISSLFTLIYISYIYK